MDQDSRLGRIAQAQPEFAELLGIRVVAAQPDQVVMEMEVTPQMANRNGVLHGGAIMGLADNAGGTATFLNIPEGQSTTTIESKTNFLRPIRIGETARATCQPLHRGRTIQVWQTTVTRPDGQVAAIVTQTQMILDWKG
ncbi:MAG: PaaI family thioesterase [Paracoccus sp. (in: a-proteobacteria)]|uniref:PaaI family thioesterase n=1 Tax=Paracoccus sp. TaxID=267 RepID=UPI0026DF9323|nr:PaaI family thioesterase [Paracoccus sp. (in: a-proteobacteria)]MDO5632001.1 PaaI family thioesterase [Paracoccus sp. (in: a-proteobacteria)]